MAQPAKDRHPSTKNEATEGAGAALPDSTGGSDAISRRLTGDEHGDDDKLDEALEDKALVEGVEAATETAQIVRALTPHNF